MKKVSTFYGDFLYTMSSLLLDYRLIKKMVELAKESKQRKSLTPGRTNNNKGARVRSEHSEPDIHQVLAEIRAGNIEAFETIVERYQGEIYKVAWHYTKSYDDTCDVVQETFMRVYRALMSWTGKAKFSTWLYRIAVNTSLDYLRRQSKHYRKRMYLSYSDNDYPEKNQRFEGVEYETPRDIAQVEHRREIVQKLLLQLSPMQRKCFILHYYQELTMKEVGEVLRCSVGSVKRHIFRARNTLKKRIEEMEQ